LPLLSPTFLSFYSSCPLSSCPPCERLLHLILTYSTNYYSLYKCYLFYEEKSEIDCFSIVLDASVLGEKPAGWDDYYASSPFEQREEIPLKFKSLEGKSFPSWLKGRVLRNTAALHEMGGRGMVHEFDGFAKIVSVRFDGTETVQFSSLFTTMSVL
jgi:hypothetical protein